MDEQLLLKFLMGQCSEEESRKIMEWISLDKANEELLFELEQVWSLKNEIHFSSEEEVDSAFESLMFELEKIPSIDKEENMPQITGRQKKINIHFPSWVKYAAAAILILFFSYTIFNLRPGQDIVWNKVEVPRGQKVSLTLSDGTKVWLNSESEISYPSSFSSKERTIKLKGEGYFEVISSKE